MCESYDRSDIRGMGASRPLSSQCGQGLSQQCLQLPHKRTQRSAVVQQISYVTEQVSEKIIFLVAKGDDTSQATPF